jgi:nitrogen regulatory protein PII
MGTPQMILLTLVTELILREQILEEILEQGAKGYTCTHVSGHGSRGTRRGPSSENIKIEILCSQSVADDIMSKVVKRYEANYALVAWELTVAVSHAP